MIDSLYVRYARRKEKPLDPTYQPTDAINSRKLLNPKSDKLIVVFPGWHTHNFPVNILADRLVRRGWAVLLYDFHDQILEPDEDVVVESFRHIRDTVCQELSRLMSKNNYQKVQFISISLGGVPLALVCDKFPHFNSVTAVLGGDNLAINMWYGLRTRAYRTAFEKMHVGVRRLAEEWQDVAPEHHLRHFRGKPVKFVMSLNDEFVGTKFQRRLLEGLIENQAVVQVKKYRTGHLLSILRFCFFGLPL